MYEFRGRTPQKVWKKGYYFARPILEKHFILNGDEQFLVEKETVGMCTGIPDMDGELLYEGDIVNYNWCLNAIEEPNLANKMVIKFKDGEFVLVPVNTDCVKCDGNCKLWTIRITKESCNMKLTGNIFDNPELLN